MRILFRIYALLFHFLLSLFLLVVAVVTLGGGANNLKLEMLPWTGAGLTLAVLCFGLVGLLITLLAVFGRLRILFPIWAAVVLVLIFRGFFLTSYTFSGKDGFHDALLLTVGALLAFLCSWAIFKKRKPTDY